MSTGIEVVRVNGKPELDGLDGRRQPLVGDTSRISRVAYLRICERLGVKFPWATRRCLGLAPRGPDHVILNSKYPTQIAVAKNSD